MSRTYRLLAGSVFLMAMLFSFSSQEATPVLAYQKAIPSTSSRPQANVDSGRDADRQDLQKMRVILNQMRNNLAFVGSTTTPLNHQFELEIDMWQLLLDQMDRRGDAGSSTTPEK